MLERWGWTKGYTKVDSEQAVVGFASTTAVQIDACWLENSCWILIFLIYSFNIITVTTKTTSFIILLLKILFKCQDIAHIFHWLVFSIAGKMCSGSTHGNDETKGGEYENDSHYHRDDHGQMPVFYFLCDWKERTTQSQWFTLIPRKDLEV